MTTNSTAVGREKRKNAAAPAVDWSQHKLPHAVDRTELPGVHEVTSSGANLTPVQTQSQPGTPASREVLSKLSAATKVIEMVDKPITEWLSQIHAQGGIRYFSVAQAEDVARVFGDTRFFGDSYTVGSRVQSPDGRTSSSRFMVSIESWLLQGDGNSGALIVAWHHELTHMRRFSDGKSLANRAQEEVATFTESMAKMNQLANQLERMAADYEKKYKDTPQGLNTVVAKDGDQNITASDIILESRQTAREMREALKKDEGHLASWRKRLGG